MLSASVEREGWTATRCHRLLSSIEGALGALRDFEVRFDEGSGKGKAKGKGKGKGEGCGGCQSVERDIGVEVEAEGERWSSPAGRGNKRLKRTYTLKGRARMAVKGKERRQQNPNEFSRFQLDMPKSYLPQLYHHQSSQTSTGAKNGQPTPPTFKESWRSIDKVSAYTSADERDSFRTFVLTFTAVLNQTQGDEANTPPRNGARSLFSTCLAIIPHFIQDERRNASTFIATQPSEECFGSSPEAYGYSELEEDFGSSGPSGSEPESGSGPGWRHLREILRYHTILLLSNAIEEGMIGLLGARELIDICLRKDAVDAAQRFLESCLSHVAAGAAQDNGARSREVLGSRSGLEDMVREFCERTGREGFGYWWVGELWEDRRTPASWLSSRFTMSTLNKAIGSLTYADSDDSQKKNHFDQAATLLRTVVRSSYSLDATASSKAVHSLRLKNPSAKRGKEAVLHFNHAETPADGSEMPLHVLVDHQPERYPVFAKVTFSVLSILSAMNILDLVSGGLSRQECLAALQTIGLEARQFVELIKAGQIDDQSPSDLSIHVILPLLAAALSNIVAYKHTSPTQSTTVLSDFSMLASLSPSSTAIKRAGSFLSAVAQDCVKAKESDNPFSHLQTILAYLDYVPAALAGEQSRSVVEVLNAIKVAASFAFCNDHCRPAHLEWAMSMEQAVTMATDASSAVGVIVRTPTRKRVLSRERYRWEEGISEWTKRTPASVASALGTPSPVLLSRLDDNDNNNDLLTSMSPTSDMTQRAPLEPKSRPAAVRKLTYTNPHRVVERPQVPLSTIESHTKHHRKFDFLLAPSQVSTSTKIPKTITPSSCNDSVTDSDTDEDELSLPHHGSPQQQQQQCPDPFLLQPRRGLQQLQRSKSRGLGIVRRGVRLQEGEGDGRWGGQGRRVIGPALGFWDRDAGDEDELGL